MIDVPMPLNYITENLIEQLELLEPFGKANEKPTFAEKDLSIINARILGKNQNVLKLKVKNSYGFTLDALYFGNLDKFNHFVVEKYGEIELDKILNGRENNVKLSITYYPSINEYNGNRSIQVVIKNFC